MKASMIAYTLAALAPASAMPPSKRQDSSKVEYPRINARTNSCPSIFNNTSPFFNFTSTYHILATPDQVVNGTTDPVFTGGLPGAQAIFDFGINADLDLICYDIKLTGFKGEYQSPARTATHIHEAGMGRNGPPRLAFPNPKGDGEGERRSVGCLQGPFTTGLLVNGTDTGEGFKVMKIESNPSGFFADLHSSLAVPGAVRGQFEG